MKKLLFLSAILMAVFTGCSSDEPVGDGGNTLPNEGESRYMSVSIRNVNSGAASRAGGDQSGNLYEEGYSEENDVKSLRFYFFDAEGNPAPVTYGGDSYYTCTSENLEYDEDKPNTNMPNVEKILNAVIVINNTTAEGDRNAIKQMVAVVNADFTGENNIFNANLSLSALSAMVNTEAEAKNVNGFLMTSSSFYDEAYGTAVEIKDTDIKANIELARKNPVDVYVERVVAKVRVVENWSGKDVDVIEGVKFGESTYTAVALKDKNGNSIRNGNSENSEQIYAIFTNWNLWWTADKSYLFKKVDNWNLGWKWNDPDNNRSYWAVNPAKVKLAKHNHLYADRKIGKGSKDDYDDYSAYCLENAADNATTGLKNWYNPVTATSNRTLVYLSAMLVTIDADKNAKAVDLAEWGGRKYTKKDVLAAMFAPNVNQYYFLHKEENVNDPVVSEDGTITESGSTDYKFITLRESDVQLVSGMKAGLADDKSEESKRYLSYVNLALQESVLWGDKTVKEGDTDVIYSVEKDKLYQKVGEKDGKGIYKEVSADVVNKALESVGGCKVWDGGNTYYYQEIMHLGKTGVDNENKDFGYGVVRNHIYELQLNAVTGLGTPILIYKDEDGKDVWEEITPQKPTPDAYFLAARLNILSWRVVNQGVSLNW